MVPLCSGLANSDRSTGTTTLSMPTPHPAKNLPTKSTHLFGTEHITAPARKNRLLKINVSRRPSFCTQRVQRKQSILWKRAPAMDVILLNFQSMPQPLQVLWPSEPQLRVLVKNEMIASKRFTCAYMCLILCR